MFRPRIDQADKYIDGAYMDGNRAYKTKHIT